MKEKRIHWTQTPKGKAILAAKKATQTGKKNVKTKEEDRVPEGIFAYALGHIEGWIEFYAKSASVSPSALAAELGAVLHRKTRR